nr:hypothetical protein CFP56_31640 [Quercus suber]
MSFTVFLFTIEDVIFTSSRHPAATRATVSDMKNVITTTLERTEENELAILRPRLETPMARSMPVSIGYIPPASSYPP